MRRALMWLCASLLLPGCAMGPSVETTSKVRPTVKGVKVQGGPKDSKFETVGRTSGSNAETERLCSAMM